MAGATIFAAVRGTGPPLLIVAGGDADANTCDSLVDRLVGDFTVITYDRRGMSRSVRDDCADGTQAPTAVDLATHTDDAYRLLLALTGEPAYVFGTSMGALIGVDLCIRHPDRIRTLVAHEPPLPQVLPASERAEVIATQERIERIFAVDGLDAAMRLLVATTGISVVEREPGVSLPRSDARRRRNLEYMLAVDTPAARRFRLDVAGLVDAVGGGHGMSVEIGGGVASGDGFPLRCAAALAGQLGRPLVMFPGGHTGYVTHPAGFAKVLRQTLGQTLGR